MKYYYCETEDLMCLLLANNLDSRHLTHEQIFDIELETMDLVASKRAGGDHMVHWNASRMLN